MNTQKNRLSRRDFLRVSGMAAMVTAIAACTAPQASTGDEASGGGEDGIEIVYLAWSGPEELKVLQTIIDGFQYRLFGMQIILCKASRIQFAIFCGLSTRHMPVH